MVSHYSIDTKLTLSLFLDHNIVQKIQIVLEARDVTPGRRYQLFLLLTKVLLFHAAEFKVDLKELPTWTLLESLRKAAHSGEVKRKVAKSIAPPGPKILTDLEIVHLRDETLAWLKTSSEKTEGLGGLTRLFMAHLVVATLLLMPAPRSQILSRLELEKTFYWNEDESTYFFSFDGLNPPLKNGKPLLLAVPGQLVAFFRVRCFPSFITGFIVQVWIEKFRPLLQPRGNILFPNTLGEPMKRWGKLTSIVTQLYLKKEISCHPFRYVLLLDSNCSFLGTP